MLQLVLIQFASLLHLRAIKLPTLHQLFSEESAQDAFEYLLVVGVMVVGIVGAMVAFPGIIPTIVTSVQNALTSAFG